MRDMISWFTRKKQLTTIGILGTLFVVGTTVAAVTTFSRPLPTAAVTNTSAACPKSTTPAQFNIIYCGLDGPAVSDYITSFRAYYNNNSDEQLNNQQHIHRGDLQTIYAWAGATSSLVSGMNTSNTKLGTIYSNGNITVNGQTVGTDAQIASRWKGSTGTYTQITNGVWSRAATTYFSNVPSLPILVHFNSNGQADFAVETPCGNAVKFTPSPPQNGAGQSLSCDSLTSNEVGDTLSYNFTANATPQNNATISSYTFYFGDGNSETVNTTATTATTTQAHTYAQNGTTYNAYAVVNGSVAANNSRCKTSLTTPVSKQPTLACVQLTATKDTTDTTGLTWKFTATASAQNTTITSYVFTFGDDTSQPVPTDALTAMTNPPHTYTTPGKYTATVSVNSQDIQNKTSAACSVTVTAGSTSGAGTVKGASTRSTLPNTGAGSVIGLFGVTSTLGGLFYHFILRRKLLA